jgi:metal-sulfur cluster biosynthetic enzyme
VPPELRVEVDLSWEPPWRSDRMSGRAKRFMGW